MTDLIDRLAFGPGVTSRPKIKVHQFTGTLRLYVYGKITAGQIVQDWDLQGDELTQAVAIRGLIDAGANENAKLKVVLLLEAVAYLLEDSSDTIYHTDPQTIDKTKVQADLGI